MSNRRQSTPLHISKETAMSPLKIRTLASMIMVSAGAVLVLAAATPARAGTSAEESAYVAALHSRLGHAVVYPTSRELRELRPQGTTQLWLDVDRAGRIQNAGVDVSSGQRLLDRSALRSVRRSRLPAMPDDAFVAERTHRFVVRVAYVADASMR
jgi:TonB family protein